MRVRLGSHRDDDTEPTDDHRAAYEARLFGPFRVMRNQIPVGGPAGLGRASARTLLKWFLLNPDTCITRLELSRMLWPDLDIEVGQRRVYSTLHYLRRFLEPELGARQPSSFICSLDAHYWFHPGCRWTTDVASIGELMAEARCARQRGDAGAAIRALEGVVACYRQTFLPEDVYDDRFAEPRASFDVIHAEAQCQLLELYQTSRHDDKALSSGLALLERDPYSEAAVAAIASVYLRQGNPAAASQHLSRFRNHLARDLGAQPGPQVSQLEHRLQRRRSVGSVR